MSACSLREIEKTLATLWLNRGARESFLRAGDSEAAAEELHSSSARPLLDQIDRRGVRLYANLMNLGHQDVMLSIYPGCARVIGADWPQVVDDYLEKFPPAHYNFNRTAARFPEYVRLFGGRHLRKSPYLAELADYEWAEMELIDHPARADVQAHELLCTPEQTQQLAPIVNAALSLRHYSYPIPALVEKLERSSRIPRKVAPAPTWVAVYRNPHTNYCKFLQLGDLAAAIISRAQAATTSYADLMALAVSSSPGRDPQQTVLEFLDLVEQLQSLRLFTGSTSVH